jgi:hypothetical protein
VIKVVAKQLQLMSKKESGRGSQEGKMCELELQNFNANIKLARLKNT